MICPINHNHTTLLLVYFLCTDHINDLTTSKILTHRLKYKMMNKIIRYKVVFAKTNSLCGSYACLQAKNAVHHELSSK